MIKLSAIIPVYSEEDVMRKVVRDLVDRAGNNLHQIILIVAPKSTFKTFQICAELATEYPFLKYYTQLENPGLGRAYRQGFTYVTGTHVLMLDADGEMDINTVPKMISAVDSGFDLAVASRWIKGGTVHDYDPLTYVLNRSFQIIFRILFFTHVHDLTYGFKIFSARLLAEVHWWGEMHEIATETTLKPIRLGYKIVEIPSVWRKRVEGVSKMNTWKRFRYAPFAFRILLAKKGEL